jgi:hypothetical protein
MRTSLAILILLGAASPALAAPWSGGPSPSYGKVASWKQRFFERRDTQWQKPAGDLFPSRKVQTSQKLSIVKPTVNEPPARGITATTSNPQVRTQVRVATADQKAPFDNTAGFGKNVRRSTALHRITWEKRIGKLGKRITMVFKARARRPSGFSTASARPSVRPKVFRVTGRPRMFRVVKPRPAPFFRRVR